MTVILPIVARELRVTARRWSTYRGRMVTVAVTLAVFLWVMLALLPQVGVPPARYGSWLFRLVFLLSLAMGCLNGVAGTADVISREKREGTLGLLFLTDLGGYDIVLGKLAATVLSTLYRLLAVVPLLGLSLQLGGVTSRELFEASVTLVVATTYAMSVGMLVSVLSRHERKAVFAALFCLLFLASAPLVVVYVLALVVETVGGPFNQILQSNPEWLFGWLVLSPLFPVAKLMFPSIPAPLGGFAALFFWPSIWLMITASALFLWGAGALLPRLWRRSDRVQRGDTPGRIQERLAFGPRPVRAAWRRRLLDINPFLWLNLRERGKRWYGWFYLGAVGLTWWWGIGTYGDLMFDAGPGSPGLWLVQAFVKVWVISESVTRLAEDRRAGTLELILSTPLTVREIVRGQWLALGRQFGLPSVILVVVMGTILGRIFTGWVGVVFGLVFVLDLLACGWAGLWFALTERSLNVAWQRTYVSILVLPWFLAVGALLLVRLISRSLGFVEPFGFAQGFLCWAAAGIVVDVVAGLFWARRRLLTEFRRVATETSRQTASGLPAWLQLFLAGSRSGGGPREEES